MEYIQEHHILIHSYICKCYRILHQEEGSLHQEDSCQQTDHQRGGIGEICSFDSAGAEDGAGV